MTRRISREKLRNENAKPVFTYEQNGTWYTVFKHGKKVDKFQGKAGLEKYGLNDNEE